MTICVKTSHCNLIYDTCIFLFKEYRHDSRVGDPICVDVDSILRIRLRNEDKIVSNGTADFTIKIYTEQESSSYKGNLWKPDEAIIVLSTCVQRDNAITR